MQYFLVLGKLLLLLLLLLLLSLLLLLLLLLITYFILALPFYMILRLKLKYMFHQCS